MTQQSNIAAAFMRLVGAANALSARIGTLSSLTTAEKTNLVAAINEVKESIQSVDALIDDASTGASKTWSSAKIQSRINEAIIAILNGADGASDTLKELADRITALAQADQGLLSFAQGQILTEAQQIQGCTNLGIGDPDFDFLPEINAELSNGL